MSIFSLDFETTSACDISRGAYRYAADPSTQILLFAIAKDDESPIVWRYDNCEGVESKRAKILLKEAVESGSPIRAFNVGFEAAICKYVLKRQLDIDPPSLYQWRCTQFLCRRSGAPPSLAKAAEFLKLGDQKNPVGKALIHVFSDQNKTVDLLPPREAGVPEKDWKKLKRTSASPILETTIPWDWTMNVAGDRITVREAWEQFIAYCRQDVVVEREVARKLAKMEPSPEVLAGFHFDLRMNDRGVPVDLPTLKMAQKLILAYEEDLTGRFEKLTGLRPSQTAKVLAWLKERGYTGNSLNVATVADVKAKHYAKLSEEGRKALDLRVALSFAAVKKVPAMMEWVCPDGCIRGAFTFYGAQKTGRWTSQGPQFQNMKKPGKKLKKLIPHIYDLLAAGELDNELVAILFGNPYEVYASLSRYFVRIPGQQIYDVDFAQVEARILPALIGCERILDKFRRGEDIYMDVANALGVDRDMGKIISLLCIAEGEQVLTDQGLVPIEKVSRCHRVWDGVEWVRHDGVICKGIQETITYQGLRATPNHDVYCRDATGQLRTIPLGVAAQQQADLVVTERCGETVRALHGDERHASSMPEGLREGAGSVRLRNFSFRRPELVASRSEPRMPGVSGRADQVGVSGVAPQPSCSATATMPEPGRSGLQDLWGQGDRVSLPEHRSGLHLDHGKLGASEGSHVGSDRQLRALRGGQPAVGDLLGAVEQHEKVPAQEGLQSERVALQPDQGDPVSSRRSDTGADFSEGPSSGCREAKELAGYSGKVRVYDIVNAGPRHRFTVSGKLVSNCQFQGGWRAIKVPLGDKITETDARKAVSIYRKENPEVVEAWETFQQTWIKALKHPGEWHPATEKVKFAYSTKAPFPRMLMRLPAGRDIVYPLPQAKPITMVRYARNVVVKTKDGEVTVKEEKSEWERLAGHLDPQQVAIYVNLGDSFLCPWERITGHFHTHELEFWGHVKDAHWGTVKTYGGDLLQSATQGTGMDFLLHGCVEAEKRGHEPFFVVHDQALGHHAPGRTLEDFIDALCTRPVWFPDFPLDADGEMADSYQKS